jgi:predicted nucleic acid-binding Zn ribbon protein
VRRRKGDPEPLSGLVPKILEDLGIGGGTRVVQVAERWLEAVGPEIAAHCKPVLFKNDTLEVDVDSSVWCQQLQLQSPEILAALREVLGDRAPSGLWFRVG